MSATRKVLQIDRVSGAVINRSPTDCVYFAFTTVRHLASYKTCSSAYVQKLSDVCRSIVRACQRQPGFLVSKKIRKLMSQSHCRLATLTVMRDLNTHLNKNV